MTPYFYCISEVPAGRIAVMPKPRGGDWLADEIKGLKQSGFDILVSLLTQEEEKSLGLTKEKDCSAALGLKFYSFPIDDRSTPVSSSQYIDFIAELFQEIFGGKSVAIHCRAGIGRTGITAASLLIKCGFSSDKAFELVSDARGFSVPDTPEQRDWVKNLEKEIRDIP